MPRLTISMPAEDAAWLKAFATRRNATVSATVRRMVLDRMRREEDLRRAIRQLADAPRTSIQQAQIDADIAELRRLVGQP